MILRKKKAQRIKDVATLYDVLIKPVTTEKSFGASEQGKTVFEVASNASKPDIKAAVEALFKVDVTSVNTLNRKGKTKTFRGTRGRQSDRKLAMVTVKDGQAIDLSGGLK